MKNSFNAVETDSEFKENLVCVVDNGIFAAAAYVYSKSERDVFLPHNNDIRPRTWLIVPNADELSNYK